MRSRVAEVLVGFAILGVYSTLAVLGLVAVAWLIAQPPNPVVAIGAFGVGVLFAAIIGYRLGTVRLVSSLQAMELPRNRSPELHRRVDDMVETMRVEKPRLMIANLEAPNALSIGGPRTGAIILDRRLFDLLTIDELETILGHELAHMENHDTFLNTLAVTSVRTLTALVLLLLFPITMFLSGIDTAAGYFAGRPGSRLGLVAILQRGVVLAVGAVLGLFVLAFFAYARRREFAADRRAATVTGSPAALARALTKIKRANNPRSGLQSLLYIHDDQREKRSLFSMHPPLDQRIARVRTQVNPDSRESGAEHVQP